MELLLWRHAEALDGIGDLQRPLSPKGQQQASKMAAWLGRHGPGGLALCESGGTHPGNGQGFSPKDGGVGVAGARLPGARARDPLPMAFGLCRLCCWWGISPVWGCWRLCCLLASNALGH